MAFEKGVTVGVLLNDDKINSIPDELASKVRAPRRGADNDYVCSVHAFLKNTPSGSSRVMSRKMIGHKKGTKVYIVFAASLCFFAA